MSTSTSVLSDMINNFGTILHLVVLVGWACVLLVVDLFIPKERKGLTALLAVLGLLVALIFTLARATLFAPFSLHFASSAFGGMIAMDGFAIFLNILFLVSGIVAIALAYDYLKRTGLERGEYYILLLFSIAGMLLMAQASDLIIVFLGLELLSIPLYVLAGFAVSRTTGRAVAPSVELRSLQPNPEPENTAAVENAAAVENTARASEEAALKYFLLGAFSTGIFVYGTALIFGATATTSLKGVVAAVDKGSAIPSLFLIGAAFILIGLGFKVAAVPFHMWTPDVYHGAPAAVTAFMSVGAKAAGFAALLRIFVLAFPTLSTDLTPVLWGLAAVTMILGNLVAIAQTNIKRLLAYSSIAHAGYILMALVPFGNKALSAEVVASVLFYLTAYAFTSFTAWAVVIAVESGVANNGSKEYNLDDFAGLGRKYPLLAAAMTVAMLSFTGVPPTLGFVGKFYVFRTVLEGKFTVLAIIGVLTSLISAYYYLRVVAIMYMRGADSHDEAVFFTAGEYRRPKVRRDLWLNLTAGTTALGTVVLSIFATPLFQWVSQAVLKLF